MTANRRQYHREWRQRNKAHVQRYERHPRRRRMKACTALRRKYGITLEQRDRMLARQRGCAGCGGVVVRLWVVDHNHETGRVRGILCRDCNTVLGLVHDNPSTLRRLARYLMK